MNAQRIVKAIPWQVWAIGGGLIALYALSKFNLGEKLGGALAGLGIGAAKAVGSAAKGAVDSVVQGITGDENQTLGGAVFDLFHPGEVGESVFYRVTFPNGASHAIAAGDVDSAGRFSYIQPPYANTRWQIYVDGAGMKLAKPA